MVCVCGHTAEQHLQEAMHPPGPLAQKWDPKIHTQERPTDAFGDMVCSDLSEKQSKYVRLSDNTPPGTIYELMTQHWGLREPNLLISVTGGAKDFTMKPRLRSVFRRGLVKVAQTTGAWVITGGTHTGVMKEVGQAVRDSSLSSRCRESRVVTVGVATWGAIHNRHSLVRPPHCSALVYGGVKN
ncbi:transient receptor potential cation channel subfamily M member 2-like isoform X2 [Erinaceus europaeus]|uniref:Transient receptor potential cation channel subfamily M member 2-like isoform X2 n=1 Tax=Erinaceus europaeus TaxID=9365 RepID=A0ABM3WVK7_ERIEU|nr:transient receptor potential cation channel subfamily M member 2-like isoform X2 [Erinaceus europaeus]